MWKLIDKGILVLLSILLLSFHFFPMPGLMVLLTAITFSALTGYFQSKGLTGSLLGIYLALCLFFPVFCLCLPLVLYDSFLLVKGYPSCAAIPVFLLQLQRGEFTLSEAALFIAFSLLSVLLYVHSHQLLAKEKTLRALRDESREQLSHLEERNASLMQKQDYEVHIAILDERTRIAREIHDNVGHMLSRSILQTGALLAVNQDPLLADGLQNLKETLDSAMNSIRSSVHDLHEESIRLSDCLRRVQEEYTFCPVRLTYDVEHSLPRGLTYAILSIVREALSNTARHSDATEVVLVLREHPALYQLVIHDNGSPKRRGTQPGIGLTGMEERVRSFHGTMTVDSRSGFRIFISIPKPSQKEESQ